MKKLFYISWFISAFTSTLYAQDKVDVLQYEMSTPWTKDVTPENVWQEYPRPQMSREDNWMNLNGTWEYAIIPKNQSQPNEFQGEILVPFAIESALSGVKKLVGEDNYLWYKKKIKLKPKEKNERILLHFEAVDWESVIYINGKEVKIHKGGYDPFYADISDHLIKGEQEIVIRVWDPTDKGTQARGKQVNSPQGIWYTPVTGIWQTVWVERVPKDYIKNIKATPDIDSHTANIDVSLNSISKNAILKVAIMAKGKVISSTKIPVGADSEKATMTVSIPEPILWSPKNPFLYDMDIQLLTIDEKKIDGVKSYLGMRKISLGKDGNGYTRILLNNQPLFQFGLLDQGWWPDGLYTAPTEEAMMFDVEKTLEMGFNMIRKHVKVEPARYYYNCDKMGVLVWQDMPNGNYLRDLRVAPEDAIDIERPLESALQFEQELKNMVDQFHLFPCIVTWVPFNEGWGQYDTERVANWLKKYDPSRLVDAPSGWADRGVGDMIDVHLYPGPGLEKPEENRSSVLGEFGGLGYPVKDHLWWDKRNWGYLTFDKGDTYIQEFTDLIKDMEGLISCGLSAAVYTQTTDVEGEVNGLMTYDRKVIKIKPHTIKEIIAPIYESYWTKRDLVFDSENRRQEWKIAYKEIQGWNTLDFTDIQWKSAVAPFSSFKNPFLEYTSAWDSEVLYLRKEFFIDSSPETLYLKYYSPKAKVKVFLNGELVEELEAKGGRKRHYTHINITEIADLLKIGKNVLAFEIVKLEDEASFDAGIYTTQKINSKSSMEEQGK